MHVSNKDAMSLLSLQAGLGYPLARRSLEDACASSHLLVVSDPVSPGPLTDILVANSQSKDQVAVVVHSNPCESQPPPSPS